LSTTFDGAALAIVAPVGPKRGVIRVRIDGAGWHRVKLTSTKNAARRVVFSHRFPSGSHSIEIQAIQGRAAIDALLVAD
jgi:hypothetical protein